MFDVLDDLENAVGKLLASEPSGDDVERLSRLTEQLEFARLREVAAFDRSCSSEMEVLRVKGETRRTPELRAAALDSICRQYLVSRGDSGGRGRGQTHLSAVVDIAQFVDSNAELVALIRAETAHGGRLSRNTLERLSCDCKISRVITDGPGQVLDVGRVTRTVSTAQ